MVVLGITFLVYCARMWARLVISKNTGLDDILVSIAMLPLFGLTISSVLGKYPFLFGVAFADIHRHSHLWLPMARLGSDQRNASNNKRDRFRHRT